MSVSSREPSRLQRVNDVTISSLGRLVHCWGKSRRMASGYQGIASRSSRGLRKLCPAVRQNRRTAVFQFLQRCRRTCDGGQEKSREAISETVPFCAKPAISAGRSHYELARLVEPEINQ